jgi:hypothetical protein
LYDRRPFFDSNAPMSPGVMSDNNDSDLREQLREIQVSIQVTRMLFAHIIAGTTTTY